MLFVNFIKDGCYYDFWEELVVDVYFVVVLGCRFVGLWLIYLLKWGR